MAHQNTPESVNDELYDSLVRHQIFLLRFAKLLTDRYVLTLNNTEARMREIILDTGKIESARTPRNILRTNKLIERLFDVRKPAWSSISPNWRVEMQDLVLSQSRFMLATYATTAPVELALVAPLLVGLVAKGSFQGRTLTGWLRNLTTTDLGLISGGVQTAISQDASPRGMAQLLTGTLAARGRNGLTQRSRNNIQSITRTSVTALTSMVNRRFTKANAKVFTFDQFVAVLDGRTTPICVTGETEVVPIGSIRKAYRRRYRGDVLIITTASGKELVGTPNHPVLTSRGWLPMQEIQPGKEVVYSVGEKSLAVSDPKNIHVPTSAAQLFDSINDPSLSDVFVERSTAAQFHGDGMGPDNEVDVVVPKSPLWNVDNAFFIEQLGEKLFGSIHDSASLSTVGISDLLSMVGRPIVPSQRDSLGLENGIEQTLGTPQISDDISRASAINIKSDDIFSFIRVGPSARKRWHDSELLEKVRDSGGSGFVLPSYFSGAGAVAVHPDNVVSVRREFRSCHVYNFETCQESYLANSLIVHNCRSLDAKLFPIGEGPIPPLHVGCRSLRQPLIDGNKVGNRTATPLYERRVLADYSRQNGISPIARTRAALPRGHKGRFDLFRRDQAFQVIGPNEPVTIGYENWLRRQAATFQDDVLGRTKGLLFRKGNLPLDRFVDAQGRENTLFQMAQDDAAAFRRAGLDPDDPLWRSYIGNPP